MLNGGEYNIGRKEFIASQRAYLADKRREIEDRFCKGLSGWQTARALSDLIDKIVGRACRYAVGQTGDEEMADEITVCALGGYGRREFCPYSDVDIMFLYEGSPSGKLVSAASAVYHTLIDIGFDVGHSFRSLQECLYMARRDHGSATSMVEGRQVYGNLDIWSHLKQQLETRVFGRNGARFIDFKIEEREERLKRFGHSIYQTEPNTKENPGGLRDYHYARWIARAKYGAGTLKSMAAKDVITEENVYSLTKAVDFLFRVRCQIHFKLKKHDDTLNINLQEQVAEDFGYAAEQNYKAVEVFMKDYYFHTRAIYQTAERLTEDCKKRSMPRTMRLFSQKVEEDGFEAHGNEVRLAYPDGRDLRRDPLNLLKIFRFAQKNGARLSRSTKEKVAENLALIDDDFRANPDARNVFFSIMGHLRGLENALRDMHETRILDEYIPEFGMVDCLMQHDMYHSYTVDEHTIIAVGNIENLLDRTEGVEMRLRGMLLELERPELLTLGLLFHDIGKVQGNRGHIARGEVILDTIQKRMGMRPDDAEKVMLLLRRHLIMSHMSQRRETFDDKAAQTLIDAVGNFENLNMLTLLTYADMKAVGPTIYTEWKGALLWQLYMDAVQWMEEGAKREVDVESALKAIKEKTGSVRSELDWERRMAAFLDSMPKRYLYSFQPDQMALHERVYRRALEGEDVAVEFYKRSQFTEIIVATKDRPQLFSKICAAVSSNTINIFRSLVFTSKDDIAFDVLSVHNAPAVKSAQNIWGDVKKDIVSLIQEKASPEDMIKKLRGNILLKKKAKRKIEPRVMFDNESSDKFTIMDTFFQDQLGLLYRIAKTLGSLEMNIYMAKIATEGELAINAFYIRNKNKEKILNEADQEKIRQALFEAIVPPVEAAARG